MNLNDGQQITDIGPQALSPAPLITQAVSFLSFAALAAQIWELMASFTDEVEYMWRGRFTLLKGLYFGSRYGMLAAQVGSQLLSFQVERWQPHPAPVCPGIFIYKAVISQMGLALIEMILLIRVYALYNQSFKAKRLLLLVFVTATILETIGNGMVIRSITRVSGCAAAKADKQGIAIFSVGAGLCQCVVFCTTVAKFYGARRAGWTRTPLTSLMLKEGVVTFILILALLTILIAYEIVRSIGAIEGIENAAFAWHIALLSIAASRLVLNMRKVAMTHLFHSSEDDTLTTVSYDTHSAQDEYVRLTSLNDSDSG